MLSNNIIIQDCGGQTTKKNLDNSTPRDDPSNTVYTPGLIVILILIGIIIGVCVFELIKWLISKNKKEIVHENVDKPTDK